MSSFYGTVPHIKIQTCHACLCVDVRAAFESIKVTGWMEKHTWLKLMTRHNLLLLQMMFCFFFTWGSSSACFISSSSLAVDLRLFGLSRRACSETSAAADIIILVGCISTSFVLCCCGGCFFFFAVERVSVTLPR